MNTTFADTFYYLALLNPDDASHERALAATAERKVFEVLSPTDRWSDVQLKVAEYLDAGVRAVCVVDDNTCSVHVFRRELPICMFKASDEFTLPEILGDFRVNVLRFFE